MKVNIEYTASDIKALILKDLEEKMDLSFDPKHLDIKVRSKQNYKSEWENAEFKAIYRQD